MQPSDFVALHRPALERDEVRHNVILANLARHEAGQNPDTLWWSLGEAGACAMKSPGYSIVLGEMTKAHCRELAGITRDLDYPGVLGPELTAKWFVERAVEFGLAFREPIPQQLHALNEPPKYPGSPGHARIIEPADAALFADWTIAFISEAVPHDPMPSRAKLESVAAEGRHHFWIVDGEPVAMAGISRRTRNTGVVSGVYTPPHLRGKGYAGSVTAAVAERIFAEGKSAAGLYTDLRNPASNRTYAKIGFRPVSRSWHYLRA
jgi:RimJ/RimL family protein N-acetyltransferase